MPRWLAAGVIVAAAAATLALNWPGHFSYDSVVQLSEGRSGDYAGQHPPVMSWLLGLADALRPGAAPFIVFDVALVDGSLLALVLLGRPGSWLAPLLAVAAAALPHLLIYPAIVWKDVLFAGAACAGFAALAWAAQLWSRVGPRVILLGASLLLLCLAALARQNGAVVWPFAAVAVGWIATKHGGQRLGAITLGAGFLAAGAALTLAATAALDTRLETTNPVAGLWRDLQTYDLAGAVAKEPRFDLAELDASAPRIAALIRGPGAAAYSPERIDTIAPILDQIGTIPGAAPVVSAQWRDLIFRHPILYLRVRASAFDRVFLTPKPMRCVLVETGVDGPAEEMALSGLSERDTLRDDAIGDYALSFAGTPAYSHAAYAVLGLAMLVMLLVRRRASDIVVAAMLASAFAFGATFALISVACDYRYLYFLDLSAIAAALYAAATFARPFPRLGGNPASRPGT